MRRGRIIEPCGEYDAWLDPAKRDPQTIAGLLLSPAIDSGAGEAAIVKYDDDKDGVVRGTELDKVPALKSALPRIDTNGDGAITAGEVNARIASWRNSRIALMPLAVTVRQNGRPLPDVEVTIVPESFLGSEARSSHGKTNSRGIANLKLSENPEGSGVHPGFYRIEVSKKVDERETIPARFNSMTEWGIEVAIDNPALLGFTVDLRVR